MGLEVGGTKKKEKKKAKIPCVKAYTSTLSRLLPKKGSIWTVWTISNVHYFCPRRNIIPTRTIIQGGWVSLSLLLQILKNG